jgi:type II secretory pathway pseudopilin PulG
MKMGSPRENHPVMAAGSPKPVANRRSGLRVPRSAFRVSPQAFTLVEIMIAVSMLSLITLGLIMTFNQTQRAFRTSVTQTDILESGRAVMNLVGRDVERVSALGRDKTNWIGFEVAFANYWASDPKPVPTPQTMQLLTRSGVMPTLYRTNSMQEFWMISREGQKWNVVGYRLDTPEKGYATLYRISSACSVLETNITPEWLYTNNVAPFHLLEKSWHKTLETLSSLRVPPNPNPVFDVSMVAEGIVHFRIIPQDYRGLAPEDTRSSYTEWSTNMSGALVPRCTVGYSMDPRRAGEVQYKFCSNVAPAAVEIELGILDATVIERMRAMEEPQLARDYLNTHAGQVNLFRQRIPVRGTGPQR